jgi:N-carbamoylputrescine amidase
MRFAVCEASPQLIHADDGWKQIADQCGRERPDLLLLNEMPFGNWVSAGPEPNREQLLTSHNLHDHGLDHLGEFSVPSVLGSRPTFEQERSVNQAFVWKRDGNLQTVHTKQFFPNEPGYYEARWFERGELRFELGEANGIQIGFLTCTDVMFPEWARYYGHSGAQVICVPRATPAPSLDRWKTVISTAAIISGCYVASSNRVGKDTNGQEFGGGGWVFDPAGELIAATSTQHPVATAELDLGLVERAKQGYPAYVEGLPVEAITKVLGR